MPKPTEETENQETDQQEAKFNFSYVECLMYAFHILARYNQDFLSSEKNKERLKDFRLRLQYFAKGTQNYIKELRHTLSNSDNNKENEEVNFLSKHFPIKINRMKLVYPSFIRIKLDE